MQQTVACSLVVIIILRVDTCINVQGMIQHECMVDICNALRLYLYVDLAPRSSARLRFCLRSESAKVDSDSGCFA